MIIVHRVRLRSPIGYPKAVTELTREEHGPRLILKESGDIHVWLNGFWRSTPAGNIVEVVYSVTEDSVQAKTIEPPPAPPVDKRRKK